MITVIVTAFNESKTIANALKFLADPVYSGYFDEIELIQVSPDKATLATARNYIKSLNNEKLQFVQLKDKGISKANALNMAFEKANSNIVVLTDGDVSFGKGTLFLLLNRFVQKKYGIACGKPVSKNPRSNFMGYISHLMVAAAHDKREKTLRNERFFPLSGYGIILDKNLYEQTTGQNLVLPVDCLVEDAYLSYLYFNNGLKPGYIPEAEIKVKFPTTLIDYFRQKKRSTGGYLQLWKYHIVSKETNSRSFKQELKYFIFPVKFARNFKELLWSLMFYPIRLVLWILMYYERKIRPKAFNETWVRIESTK